MNMDVMRSPRMSENSTKLRFQFAFRALTRSIYRIGSNSLRIRALYLSAVFFYRSSCPLISPVDSKLILFWNYRSDDPYETERSGCYNDFSLLMHFWYISSFDNSMQRASFGTYMCVFHWHCFRAIYRFHIRLILLIKCRNIRCRYEK